MTPRPFACAIRASSRRSTARRSAGRRDLRGDTGDARPDHELRLARLCRRHDRSRDRPLLPDHAGAGDRDLDRAAVLHPRDQPARGRRARREAEGAGAGALRALAARRARLPAAPALRRDREAAAREVRSPAAPPGSRLFDETMARLRFPFDGKDADRAEVLDLLSSNGRERAQGRRPSRSARCSGDNIAHLRADHQHAGQGQGDRGPLAQVSRARSRRATSRNFVEDEVVDALVAAVRAAYPRLSHRYYKLKAQWFGVETARLLGPQRAAARATTTAASPGPRRATIVLDAYGAFSPELADDRQAVLRQRAGSTRRRGRARRRAPSRIRRCRSAHPYLLLNYQGKARDVMTLAHELGHGVHQVLAAPQGALMADTPLTLAETASVFGEMLTFRRCSTRETDPKRAQGDARRQGRGHAEHGGAPDRLLRFRDAAARRAPRGRADAPSASARSGWRCSARASARRSASTTSTGVYWTYIPHFIHSPFYVYAYAFGDCLVNSLYAVYQDAPAGLRREVSRHAARRRHASATRSCWRRSASTPPIPAFWDKGLGVIAGFIDELEN